MTVYLIWLSVSQSNYVNIVSKCKALGDLGEQSSDSVSALPEVCSAEYYVKRTVRPNALELRRRRKKALRNVKDILISAIGKINEGPQVVCQKSLDLQNLHLCKLQCPSFNSW